MAQAILRLARDASMRETAARNARVYAERHLLRGPVLRKFAADAMPAREAAASVP